MELALISPPDCVRGEQELLVQMFAGGLCLFHLRKPGWSADDIDAYLAGLDQGYYRRIVLHEHSQLALRRQLGGIYLSARMRCDCPDGGDQAAAVAQCAVSTPMHSESELRQAAQYSHVFLSPVFDSISKPGLRGRVWSPALPKLLDDCGGRVFALGGVKRANIRLVREMGFCGAALLGAVWQARDPLQSFCQIQEECAAYAG